MADEVNNGAPQTPDDHTAEDLPQTHPAEGQTCQRHGGEKYRILKQRDVGEEHASDDQANGADAEGREQSLDVKCFCFHSKILLFCVYIPIDTARCKKVSLFQKIFEKIFFPLFPCSCRPPIANRRCLRL